MCTVRIEAMEAVQTSIWQPVIHAVRQVRRELADTVSLELAPEQGLRAPFLPGQFNMLYVFGIGEIAISISGDARERAHWLHTVRDVGKVSAALTRLKPEARIGVRGPFGSSWPVREAEGKDLLIIAGGLGLAPLRPAIYHVLAERARYRRVAILIGMRHPEALLFEDELDRWRKQTEVEVTVDQGGETWQGHVGVVTTLIPRARFDPVHTLAMLCGPEIMMRFTVTSLQGQGVPDERIYLSMERNMKCALGLCGHCQWGPDFVCKDGPVLRYDRIAERFRVR